MTQNIISSKAPNLPLATRDYEFQYQDQLNNILRLYFNTIDNAVGEIIRFIDFPYIAASGNSDQYADGNDDPTIVTWDTASEIRGFTLNNDNTATALRAGIYKIDYSLQFANTDNAAHDIYIWLQVDGADVPYSSSKFTIPARKSVGDYSFIVAYSSIVFEIQVGEKIGLWWATDKAYSSTGPIDGVYMEHIAAQTSPPYNRPANPAAVGSITFVAAIPPP